MFLLAKHWNDSIDPTGWICSEKLDGCRAYWNGKHFLTRNANRITPPSWSVKDFPSQELDGELWAGRGTFEKTLSIIKGHHESDWKSILYCTFDIPRHPCVFKYRIQACKDVLGKNAHAFVIPFWICESKVHLLQKLNEVVAGGGEGIMLRKPDSLYERRRSDTLLKVKKHFDAEAVVIGYEDSKARPGLCGALKVINKEGKAFKVASGLTEDMIQNPPCIGTIITYKYELLSADGIPRPATYLRKRDDV